MLARSIARSIARAPASSYAAVAFQGPSVLFRSFSITPRNMGDEKIVHDMVHFKTSTNKHPLGVSKTVVGDKPIWENPMHHSVWTDEEVNGVRKTHRPMEDFVDRLAFSGVKLCRWSFDTFSGFRFGELTESKVISRICFLETVAAVPGMTAGMLRHLRSLRRMDRDHGWIHTLLEEAENERMHLLTFVKLKKPSYAFRTAVVATQGIFMNLFFVAYIASPRFCHRFVGYLEEEAVKTYTDIIHEIDNGKLKHWQTQPAPQIAIDYWHLRPDASMRDLMLAVRMDEANHRDVNHTFASLRRDQTNPYVEGHSPAATQSISGNKQ